MVQGELKAAVVAAGWLGVTAASAAVDFGKPLEIGAQIDGDFHVSTLIGAAGLIGDPASRYDTIVLNVASLRGAPPPTSIFWSIGSAATVYEVDSPYSPGHPVGMLRTGWVFGFDGGRGMAPVTALAVPSASTADWDAWRISFRVSEKVVPVGKYLAVGRADSAGGLRAFTYDSSLSTLSFNGSALFFSAIQASPIAFSFERSAPVPEAGTAALCLLGLLPVLWRTRRHPAAQSGQPGTRAGSR
jgi:hypothetical protein